MRTGMRRLSMHLESVPPTAFILLVGMTVGSLRGLPGFFTDDAGRIAGPFAPLAIAVISLLSAAVTLLLVWVAIRRRQLSIWKTAWHLTIALVLAGLLHLALAYVAASIETNGRFIRDLMQAPLSTATSGLSLVLLQAPLWFAGSAILIALGRAIAGTDGPTPRADP